MEISSKITTRFDEDSQDLMTETIYPIYRGESKLILNESDIKEITDVLFALKLNRYYDCIAKAKVVAMYLGITHICLGSVFVESTEPGVSYGYMYNPPLELHAWVLWNSNIIDFALAGTIENGLKTKDEFGPFLIGREPIILAGTPPKWAKYKAYELLPVKEVKEMDIETAKKLIYKLKEKWK